MSSLARALKQGACRVATRFCGSAAPARRHSRSAFRCEPFSPNKTSLTFPSTWPSSSSTRFPGRCANSGPRSPTGSSVSTTADRPSMRRPISATSGPSSSTTWCAGSWSSSFPGKVKHVRNLTDVDDRTIGQARAEKRPLGEITRKWTELFHADCVGPQLPGPARRADRDGHHPGAGRHDRRPHEEGQRLPLRGRLGLFQDQLVPRLRGALPDQGARAQGHQQRLRRRPQGRPRRLRALEGLQARGGRRCKVAGARRGGRGAPGLAHRVQRHDQEAPRRDDRPAHRGRRPALPPPRERDRPEPVLQRRRPSPATGTTASTCSSTARP